MIEAENIKIKIILIFFLIWVDLFFLPTYIT